MEEPPKQKRKFNISLAPILIEAIVIFLILAVSLLLEFHSRDLLFVHDRFDISILNLIVVRSAVIALVFTVAFRFTKSGLLTVFGLIAKSFTPQQERKRSLSGLMEDIYITLAFILATVPVRPILQKVFVEADTPTFENALVRFDAIPSVLILAVVGVPLILLSLRRQKDTMRLIYPIGMIASMIAVGVLNNKPNYDARVYESRADWITRDWEGQAVDAQKALEDAQTDREKAVAYYWLAVAANRQGQHEQARDDTLKAIELDPSYGAPHSSLATAYRMLGDMDKAKFHALRCIELSPEYAWCYFSLAAYYGVNGEDEAAWTNLEKAYQLDPNAVDIKNAYESAKAFYGK